MPYCKFIAGRAPSVNKPIRDIGDGLPPNTYQEIDLSYWNRNSTIVLANQGHAGSRVAVTLNLCKAAVRNCSNGGLSTYGCAVAHGRTFPLGETIQPSVVYNLKHLPVQGVAIDESPMGVKIDITGARCFYNAGVKQRTSLTLMCDPTVAGYTVLSTDTGTSCLYKATLLTKYACPMCSNASFVKVSTPMKDGRRRVTYHYADAMGELLNAANCVGGAPLPAEGFEAAPFVAITDKGELLGVLVTIVVIFLLLGCLIGYLCYVQRKAEKKLVRMARTPGGGGGGGAPALATPPRGDGRYSEGRALEELEQSAVVAESPVPAAPVAAAPPAAQTEAPAVHPI
jgi:hypothetical protein